MTQIQWAADRGRPGVPVVPSSRIPPKKMPAPTLAPPPEPTPAPPKPVLKFRKPPNMTDAAYRIALEVGLRYDVTLPQMMEDLRYKEVVHARWETWYRIWRELGHSYPRIARAFGKDHSTVIYGVRQHQKRVREAAKG